MSDSFVGTPTEGSGPLIDAEQESKGGQTVKRQRVQAYSPAVVQATYTRLANTTAYTAGDSLSDAVGAPTPLSFAAARFNGGGGVIVGAQVIEDSNPGTKATYELWLFNGAAAPTATDDNIAIAWTDANVLECFAVIDFASGDFKVGGSPGNTVCPGKFGGSAVFEIPFRCSPGVSTIWGMVVVRNGYTPASGGKIRFSLNIRQE
jgi:hypothetical protein